MYCFQALWYLRFKVQRLTEKVQSAALIYFGSRQHMALGTTAFYPLSVKSYAKPISQALWHKLSTLLVGEFLELAYPKPWHSVGLPPGRSPPKGEVSVGVASGFPTSLSPLYKNDARPQRGWSPHLQGVGNHSLKPPHSSPLPRFTNRHLSTLLEGSTLVP